MSVGQVAEPTDEPGGLASRFTLAVLPDTQFYSRYAASQFERPDRYGPGNNPFASQTAWLAEHADQLRIPFVAHLGDVVDQVNQSGEWQTADRAMQTLTTRTCRLDPRGQPRRPELRRQRLRHGLHAVERALPPVLRP